ncbi:MAG: biotin-dependent carboxyltransferase family protein [Lysobacteraceae bacterium]|nr:MAG: biotin-dependent carboxyltransferase family protein [Xanthomonadaceae bacterium]
MNAAHALIQVVSAGSLTTVQDTGRERYRDLGVGRAGTLDPEAAALTNRLVGNAASDALLEITLHGPVLRFAIPVRIALYGAPAPIAFKDAGGATHPLRTGRPIDLPAGSLRIGAIRDGLRVWLAFAGGIDAPRILDSRSTDLRGGFGGLDGRALRADDTLTLCAPPCVSVDRPVSAPWWVAPDIDALFGASASSSATSIRYVPSTHPSALALGSSDWRVDPRSDRQGLRLAGASLPNPLPEQISAPVAPGTIQLPPDGQPIVLLADAQTVGGYPRLGHAIGIDLPRLAQCRPGQPLRFEAVTQGAAHRLWRERQAQLSRLCMAIDDKLRR